MNNPSAPSLTHEVAQFLADSDRKAVGHLLGALAQEAAHAAGRGVENVGVHDLAPIEATCAELRRHLNRLSAFNDLPKPTSP